ncbi:MAG: NAD(P)/FAD-dependent oxidoreductase [Longimicrobiales bacterium]
MSRVVIIGGGPGGSTLGTYLSQAGIDNVIVEKAIHPRPHVGESMVTATTRIFDEIGFLPTMEREGFVHKFGAAWHPITGGREFGIAFAEFPQEGVNQPYTYHVDRAHFDLLLLKHAEAAGSKVIQGARAQSVELTDGVATGVNVEIAGESVLLPADIVVDASGRDAIVGRQLRLKENDTLFDQYAVHAWFDGVDRSGSSSEYIHIYFLPVERGWAWQIPITETTTSMGVVAERAVFRKAHKEGQGVEAYFDGLIASNPVLAKAMAGATRVNDLTTDADYSYSMKQFCGDGYLLVGDAARFVDPIFSSGVSVAMHSAKFAAERIEAALSAGDVSRQMLLPYEEKLKAGVAIWYDFIKVYYKLLPGFTRFIQSEEHRHGVLQLLQGDVYDREDVPVLDAMRAFVKAVEDTDDHVLKGALTDIPLD